MAFRWEWILNLAMWVPRLSTTILLVKALIKIIKNRSSAHKCRHLTGQGQLARQARMNQVFTRNLPTYLSQMPGTRRQMTLIRLCKPKSERPRKSSCYSRKAWLSKIKAILRIVIKNIKVQLLIWKPRLMTVFSCPRHPSVDLSCLCIQVRHVALISLSLE